MIRNFVIAGAVVALGVALAPTASADTFNLNDIYCNCLPAGSTAGGTVAVTVVDANDVKFDITLGSGLNFHNTNGFDAFAFTYQGAGTLSITGATSGFALYTTAQGNGSMDGAGHSYTDYIDCLACAKVTGVSELVFTVHSTTAITPTTFEVVASGNNNDFAAAVTQTAVSGCTGVVGGGNGTGNSTPQASTGHTGSGSLCGGAVPEPTSVLLLGTVLAIAGKFLKSRLAV